MKLRAPKPKMLSSTGDYEADRIIHHVRAAKKLEKERSKQPWQMASAAASDRRLLIGNSRVFRMPK